MATTVTVTVTATAGARVTRGFFRWWSDGTTRIAAGWRFVFAEVGRTRARVLDWASADQAELPRPAFERRAVPDLPRRAVVRRCLKRVPRASRTRLMTAARRALDPVPGP